MWPKGRRQNDLRKTTRSNGTVIRRANQADAQADSPAGRLARRKKGGPASGLPRGHNASRYAIFDDVRFANEAVAIRNAGGKVYRVSRQDFEVRADSHISELGLPEELIDGEIEL